MGGRLEVVAGAGGPGTAGTPGEQGERAEADCREPSIEVTWLYAFVRAWKAATPAESSGFSPFL